VDTIFPHTRELLFGCLVSPPRLVTRFFYGASPFSPVSLPATLSRNDGFNSGTLAYSSGHFRQTRSSTDRRRRRCHFYCLGAIFLCVEPAHFLYGLQRSRLSSRTYVSQFPFPFLMKYFPPLPTICPFYTPLSRGHRLAVGRTPNHFFIPFPTFPLFPTTSSAYRLITILF